jgi:hypothetical protein
MGLSTLVNNLVALGKNLTKDLQVDVGYERCLGEENDDVDIAGNRKYDTLVTYQAIQKKRTKFVPMDGGVQSVEISTLTFLQPLLITTRDRITLVDGSQPQITSVDGLTRPDGLYYAPMVSF